MKLIINFLKQFFDHIPVLNNMPISFLCFLYFFFPPKFLFPLSGERGEIMGKATPSIQPHHYLGIGDGRPMSSQGL